MEWKDSNFQAQTKADEPLRRPLQLSILQTMSFRADFFQPGDHNFDGELYTLQVNISNIITTSIIFDAVVDIPVNLFQSCHQAPIVGHLY
jgi:hypothetical protein